MTKRAWPNGWWIAPAFVICIFCWVAFFVWLFS